MPVVGVERVIERLAKGKPVPAVVLEGSDSYLRDLCRRKLVERFVPEGTREWALTQTTASEGMEAILGRAQTMPMLAPLQVLIVSEVESLEGLGEKAREEVLGQLEAYLDDPAPFTMLVLEAVKLDGRLRLSKMLAEKALVVRLVVTLEEAAVLATQMAKEMGVALDSEASTMLVEILNGEPARIRVELEKLALYVLDRGRVTSADVEALVVSARRLTVWQLADMLAGRKHDAALKFLDNILREGEQPAGIVGALAWMYRKLIEASEMPQGTNGYQASRVLGMPPDRAATVLQQSRRFRRAELLDAIRELSEADNRLKSGIHDSRALMEFLVTRLAGSGENASAAP
jgi:DNA polymerase III subunit delta